MMAIEGTLLTAIVARLNEPEYNLAAYGVALAVALLVEAPVIMMMTASTALVTDRLSYFKLRNFAFSLSLIISVLMGLLAIPSVFRVASITLLKLPTPISELTIPCILILLPWPGMIGYRRFYQGLLIRDDRTHLVAVGTFIRLMTMAAVALGLFLWGDLPGSWIAATSLSAGVTVEAIASRKMANQTVKHLLQLEKSGQDVVSYPFIANFYYPLALTSLLALGVHPILTFLVAHSPLAISSLAVLPVVSSFVFLFRSAGLAYQEVAVALLGKSQQSYFSLKKFSFLLMISTTFLFALVAFTPLCEVWYRTISGLSDDLSNLAVTATQLLLFIPALSVFLSLQRGLMVSIHQTPKITWATLIEVSIIASSMLLLIWVGELPGAISASIAMLLGRSAAVLYLLPPLRKATSLIGISSD
jgi:hypothetical protein